MERISVKRPSAKSLAKLKKGMPVRLSAGEGMNLCVNPASYNHITRSFAKGRGINMALSPDEVAENHGRGFFDAVKKGADKFASKATDRLVEHAVKTGEEHLERALTGRGTKKGQPRMTARRAYEDTPSQYGGALDNDILEKINEYTGQKLGHLAKSSAVQAGARMLRGNLEGAFADALHRVPMLGYGLSAEPSMGGYGMYAEGMGGRMRRREVSSVGMGGSLLGMPPALMSQPYSANFQFASRLPPAYQGQIRSGSGLY